MESNYVTIKEELRKVTKSIYHVYEKSPNHGYEKKSKLFVRYNDESSETTYANDDPKDVLDQMNRALHKALYKVNP